MRNPQTLRVFFVGGHANGYFDTFSSLEHDHLLHKIVVLRGSRGLAPDLDTLPLQICKIDNLFRDRDDDENIVYSPGAGTHSKSPVGQPQPQTPSMASHLSDCHPADVASARPSNGISIATSAPPERSKLRAINPHLVCSFTLVHKSG